MKRLRLWFSLICTNLFQAENAKNSILSVTRAHFNLKLKLLWMLSTHEPSNCESVITLFQSMIATTKKRIILWSWFYLPFAGAKYTRIQTRYKLHQLVVIFFYDSCHIKPMLFVVVIKSMPCFRLSLHAHFIIYWNRLSFALQLRTICSLCF